MAAYSDVDCHRCHLDVSNIHRNVFIVNIPKRNFITRKEVAQVLEVSVRTVERHERQLGLDRARPDMQIGRSIYYFFDRAERELRERGLWP